MKRIVFFIIFSVFAFNVFTGCKSNGGSTTSEDVDITVSGDEDDTLEIMNGEVLEFSVSATSTLDIKSYKASNSGGNVDFSVGDSSFSAGTTSINIKESACIEANPGDLIALTFTVNNEKESESETRYVKIKTPKIYAKIDGPDTAKIGSGQTVKYEISANSDVDLKSYSVVANSQEVNFAVGDSTFKDGTKIINFNEIVTAKGSSGDIISLTFNLKADGVQSTIFKYILITTPEIAVAKDVNLNYVSTSLDNNMFFCVEDGKTYAANADTSKLDVGFIWQTSYAYTIVSPDANLIKELYSYNGITYNTTDKKHTKIMKYTGSVDDINAETINSLDIKESYIDNNSNNGVGVASLNAGDMIAFQTADNRKGILVVKSNAKVSKTMVCDIYYQTEANAGGR